MTEQDIADAMNARLALFPGLPDVSWEGIVYQPVPGRPYLSPVISSYVRRGAGAGVFGAYQIDGTWTVTVCRPADEGRQPAGIMAAQLVAWFGRGTVLTAGGLPLILLECSEGAATYAGPWVRIPVQATFTATG